MFNFIFHYNYCNSWYILILFVVFETEMNTKQTQNALLQPNYVYILPGKTKNYTKTAERLL